MTGSAPGLAIGFVLVATWRFSDDALVHAVLVVAAALLLWMLVDAYRLARLRHERWRQGLCAG